MDNETIVAALHAKAKQEELSQRALALRIGISPQYLNDILRGKRNPGPTVLQYLGLVKVTDYHKV